MCVAVCPKRGSEAYREEGCPDQQSCPQLVALLPLSLPNLDHLPVGRRTFEAEPVKVSAPGVEHVRRQPRRPPRRALCHAALRATERVARLLQTERGGMSTLCKCRWEWPEEPERAAPATLVRVRTRVCPGAPGEHRPYPSSIRPPQLGARWRPRCLGVSGRLQGPGQGPCAPNDLSVVVGISRARRGGSAWARKPSGAAARRTFVRPCRRWCAARCAREPAVGVKLPALVAAQADSE